MTDVFAYEPRAYRDFGTAGRFTSFRVVVETSDLYVKALCNLEAETEELVRDCRNQIEQAIARRPEFLKSLVPVEEDPRDTPVVLNMIRAGRKAGTGPMAAVAGAVADYVGRRLLSRSPELIIENGGDIFLKVAQPIVVGVFAGSSPLSGRLGIRVEPTALPLGICTSSAKVGPSLSLGAADAATVVSRDVPLADAVATGLGNRVRKGRDLKKAVHWAMEVPGVLAALAIIEDKIAVQGDLQLVPLDEESPGGGSGTVP